MRGAAVFLVALGLLQMGGDLVGSPALRGVAAATAASPAPRVFSSVGGLETYSTRFYLEWVDRAGVARELRLSPEVYARLRGPYNRRNAYGAVLAYGPLLSQGARTSEMFRAVASYALCGRAPLLRELGIDPDELAGDVRVRLEPREGAVPRDLPLVLEPGCG